MRRICLSIFIFGSLFIMIYQIGHGQGIDQSLQCLKCHQDKVKEKVKYKHPPFGKKNCIKCHGGPGIIGKVDKNHKEGLRIRDDMGIRACYSCHLPERLGISHPVGIYPSGKIRIPETLPTGSLGQLLCITCHHPHGGNEEYLGRKPVSAQLCITCHGRDYYE
jgi:predicted CXXCH cytochrome family protein